MFPDNSIIQLQTHHSPFIRARKRGGLVADRQIPNAHERFIVKVINVLKIALLTYHGYYVCSNPDGHIEARIVQQDWEVWTVEKHGNRYAFKSKHGKYLCAEPDGRIVANRERVDSWEKFTITYASINCVPNSATGHYTNIIDNLYIGDQKAVRDTRFGSIVSLMESSENTPVTVASHLKVYVKDDEKDSKTFAQNLPHIASFIDAASETGKDVLIHCRAGRHRSVAALCGYLIWKKGYSYQDARNLIASKRDVGKGPRVFKGVLKSWRKKTKHNIGNKKFLFHLQSKRWHG